MSYAKATYEGNIKIITDAGLMIGCLRVEMVGGKTAQIVEMPGISQEFFAEQKARGAYLPWVTSHWLADILHAQMMERERQNASAASSRATTSRPG